MRIIARCSEIRNVVVEITLGAWEMEISAVSSNLLRTRSVFGADQARSTDIRASLFIRLLRMRSVAAAVPGPEVMIQIGVNNCHLHDGYLIYRTLDLRRISKSGRDIDPVRAKLNRF